MALEPVAGHRYTEQEIQASLRQTLGNHSALSQVRFDPWASEQSRKIRRIDLLAVENNCDVEKRRHVLAFEIKTSRSDFRTDVNDPSKQAGWRAMSSGHYFVAPAGIIRPDELPEGSGLVELSRWRRPGTFVGNRVVIVRQTPDKGRVHLPGWLVQELLYRVSSLERATELTSRSVEVPPEQAIAMDKQEHKIEHLKAQVAWLRKQVGTWRHIGSQLGAACKQCGAALEVIHDGVVTHAYTGEGFDHVAVF